MLFLCSNCTYIFFQQDLNIASYASFVFKFLFKLGTSHCSIVWIAYIYTVLSDTLLFQFHLIAQGFLRSWQGIMIVCGVCCLFICLFVCLFVVVTLPPHDFSEWLKMLNFCLYSHLFVFLFAQPYPYLE